MYAAAVAGGLGWLALGHLGVAWLIRGSRAPSAGSQAMLDALPYPGGCDKITPAYRKLIGLSLARDFRKKVRELLGGTQGCTHLTEMLAGMPTAAIQTFAGEMKEERDDGAKPFQLDQCHALETSTETVKLWYPKWFKGKAA